MTDSPANGGNLPSDTPHSPTSIDPAGARTAHSFPLRRVLEVVEALLLGVVAVATAWGGYQAARWSGLQSTKYSEASATRVEATRAATHAGQLSLYDVSLFNQWLNAEATGQTQLAGMYERRFRPEFRPSFQAWVATDPFHNVSAPPGPLFMPQYKVAEAERADALEAQAAQAFDEGKAANQQSDDYVLNAVFLASTLFFVAIGQRFDWIAVRLSVAGIAFAMLGYGIYHLAIYPVY